ncbi:hypothetical protein [Chitinophaga varians]|uniref:hypothetical protein n=1 Tax=Chitinophaga varians TaxID=2202339 RepID=UPI00165F426E|nr:hypothetical protein [Chitinophaga varians]MBC9910233.1 hypothetical protein [Chitinophaga varians]
MKYYLSLLTFLFLFACGAAENAQQQTGTDSSGANTAEIKSWLEKLPVIKSENGSLYLVRETAPGPFNDRKFKKFSAGKLAGSRKFIPVLVEYEFDAEAQLLSSQLLVTFTPDGKEIARQEVGGLRLTAAGGSEDLRSWPVMFNDTTIEVREARSQGKSQVRHYVLTAGGDIRAVPPEKGTFEEYTTRFPALQLPFAVGSPVFTKLREVSHLSPWFSYEEVIGYDKLNVYHYGSVAATGKPRLLLYAYGPANDDGADLDTAVQVVACKPDGSVTDLKTLYGRLSGEGIERRWRNAEIQQDGSITVEESNVDDAEMASWELTSTETRLLTYRLDAAGMFQPEIRGITFAVPAYSLPALKAIFEHNKEQLAQKEGEHITEILFGIQDRMPFGIAVWVHFYQHGQQQLAELFTTDDTRTVLDRYVLYNYPEAAAYQAVKIPLEAGEDKAHPVTNLTGPVTIQLGATSLQVTPEGKFVKL